MKYQAVIAAACLVLAAPGMPAQEALKPSRPGREVSLPASAVKDTFFAYVLGIIISGGETEIDNEQMRSILVEFKSALDVPFDLITRVTQHQDPDTARRRIGIEFQRDFVMPVPFAILFYHPGSITASRQLSFDVRQSAWADPASDGTATPVFDLALADGRILVDIDDWLEALFSDHLEDTWVSHIVFFQWHADWIGMIAGSGRSSLRTKRAYFDFTKNAIIFPVPESLQRAGKDLLPD